jgi:hypothetical protein
MYRGIIDVRGANENIKLTPFEKAEYKKCKKSLAYFIEHYVHINTKDHGLELFKLTPRQKKEVGRIAFRETVHGSHIAFHSWYRQAGYSSIVMAYVLWKMIFTPNTTTLLPKARKWKDGIYNMYLFHQMYIELPYWLKPGVTQWSKNSVSFENLSHITLRSLNKSCDQARGFAVNILVLDYFDGAPAKVAKGIIRNLIYTISQMASGKVFISGLGPNDNTVSGQYWKANKKSTDCWFSRYSWEENPKFDKKWADEEMRKIGKKRFREYYCR